MFLALVSLFSSDASKNFYLWVWATRSVLTRSVLARSALLENFGLELMSKSMFIEELVVRRAARRPRVAAPRRYAERLHTIGRYAEPLRGASGLFSCGHGYTSNRQLVSLRGPGGEHMWVLLAHPGEFSLLGICGRVCRNQRPKRTA